MEGGWILFMISKRGKKHKGNPFLARWPSWIKGDGGGQRRDRVDIGTLQVPDRARAYVQGVKMLAGPRWGKETASKRPRGSGRIEVPKGKRRGRGVQPLTVRELN